MTDREKVIRGLERCAKGTCPSIFSQEYRDCEYMIGLYCGQKKLLNDALKLIVDQEAERFKLMDIVSKLTEENKNLKSKIIHCKDCKYYNSLMGSCKDGRSYPSPEWYCADAEIKDGWN